MAEPIDLPFGLWTWVGQRKHMFNHTRQVAPMCPHGRAHWTYGIGPLSVCPVCNVGALWPNGWMDQDEAWRAGKPRPGHTALDGDPASPPQKGAHPAPIFGPCLLWPKFIVAKRLDGSRWHLARR